MADALRITVVGGGIMGCCAARSLMAAGHRVTLVEQEHIGHQGAASVDHHRLIRVAYGALPGYASMAQEAFPAWNRLWAEMGVCHYVDSGTLIAGRRDSEWIASTLAGLPSGSIQPVSADGLPGLLPGFDLDPTHIAVLVRPGGILLARRILSDLKLLLREAVLVEGRRVSNVLTDTSQVHLDDGAVIESDHTVVCTGAWEWPGQPPIHRTPSRQTALYLLPDDAQAWQNSPFLLDLSSSGGFYFVPPVAGLPAKLGTHTFSRQGSVNDSRTCSDPELEALRALMRVRAPGLLNWSMVGSRACYYDVTPDERFVFRRAGRTTFLGGFSGHGFKFAPLIGERLAGLFSGRQTAESFANWLAGW